MIDTHRPPPDRPMPESSLQDWLAELERRHSKGIELGLDRVGTVWTRLGAPEPADRVITVGGTNGKGSVVAFLESAAAACGWRVGAYTSPHLLRYNERIRISGIEAVDTDIVRMFQRIESARGDIMLTYFEFGTLAALLLMAQASPRLDLAVLEVGLGGRLDAVNIIDADVAVVTTVALDHQDWLGDSRALIAREKAGIARSGRPVVVGERDAEEALIHAVRAAGATPVRIGHDFETWENDGIHRFRLGDAAAVDMPQHLRLTAPCQWDNAATALAALSMLPAMSASAFTDDVRPSSGDSHPRLLNARDSARGAARTDRAESKALNLAAAAQGLASAQLSGRLERLSTAPDVIVDVGHNPQAAAMLAEWLRGEGADRTTDAVFSALSDKDIEGIVTPLLPFIRHWYIAGLDRVTPRGLSADEVVARVQRAAATVDRSGWRSTPGNPISISISVHATVTDALASARATALPDERVLAFGSFHVVAEVGKSLSSGL